jgi:hypothetical protein
MLGITEPVQASAALMNFCRDQIEGVRKGSLHSKAIRTLIGCTACPQLSLQLSHVYHCLSKEIENLEQILGQIKGNTIRLREDNFPITKTFLDSLLRRNFPIQVGDSEERFAPLVFSGLVRSNNFNDFKPLERSWRGDKSAFRASQALLSLAPSIFNSKMPKGAPQESKTPSDCIDIEELKAALKYLSERDETVINDLSNTYLFSTCYSLDSVVEACTSLLKEQLKEDPSKLWELSRQCSILALPSDSFTEALPKMMLLPTIDNSILNTLSSVE